MNSLDLTLIRDYTDLRCTLGVLAVVGAAFAAQTLELPWDPLPGATCGRPDRSCVPAGTYQLVLHDTPKHPKTWALVNPELGIYHEPGDVPAGCIARIACLIHVANFTDELEGCIAVGNVRGKVSTGERCIYESRPAFQALQAAVPWIAGHTLTIGYAAGVTPP